MTGLSRLLLVDDNTANLRILQLTFAGAGFDVLTATSVKAAQQILLQEGKSITLVVSDIQMPQQTGFDLVRWMKEERHGLVDIPILLITSQLPDAASRIHGLSLGANDYVLRTLDPEELVLRVKHAIENYERVKSLRESLEDNESQALIARVLAASNHEIKNLISIVSISTDVLTRTLKNQYMVPPDAARQALQAISQSASMLADVSRTMGQAPSKTFTLSIVPLDGFAIILETLSMMRLALKKLVVVQPDPVNPQNFWCLGSATHLKQILINFLLNARQAIAENGDATVGVITVTIERTRDADQKEFVAFTVQDNGPGLPGAESRSNFEAFATTKQMRGGQGLGLWLCARFAEEMHGTLTLSSEGPGRGARATLILPGCARVDTPKVDLSGYMDDQDGLDT